MHAMVVAVVLKSGHQRASRVRRWWSWTASQRSTKLCSSIELSACKRRWLASKKKSSSWRITSSNWWRRSGKRPSEWHGPERKEQRKRDGENNGKFFLTIEHRGCPDETGADDGSIMCSNNTDGRFRSGNARKCLRPYSSYIKRSCFLSTQCDQNLKFLTSNIIISVAAPEGFD